MKAIISPIQSSRSAGKTPDDMTNARNRLIEIVMIEPVECTQWEFNRWGVRDRIKTD